MRAYLHRGIRLVIKCQLLLPFSYSGPLKENIIFSPHDVFLEQHSPCTLKVKTLDKDNMKVSRSRKTKGSKDDNQMLLGHICLMDENLSLYNDYVI